VIQEESRWYRWEGDDLLLSLRIQPRAGQDAFIAPHGDQYKVRITAPPVEGKANAHLLRFLAKAFGVKRSDISLMAGESSRNKAVRIHAPQKLPLPVVRN
jgi:uncharacterized protein (TIGR00251 family)